MKKQKTQEELDGEALDLLMSHDADRFALALDRHGWMIVLQPENADENRPSRWFMNGTTKECPPWADPKFDPSGHGFTSYPSEPLRVIDGDKDQV